MFFEKAKMEDDAESVDMIPKIQELHVIHIFGFDGKFEQQQSSNYVNLQLKLQERFH